MEGNLNKERSAISSMFNNIAGDYDKLNKILSLGIDRLWRKKLTGNVLKQKSLRLLDIACGTGDVSIGFYRNGISVVGLDIAENMLEIAREKTGKEQLKNQKEISAPVYVKGSAEEIPFGSGTFDAVAISFGIRNFENRPAALKEIYRVLSDKGTLSILEFSMPRNFLWRIVYKAYFSTIVPFVGKMISHDRNAYKYLPASVKTFPQYEEFCREMSAAGFSDTAYYPLSGGITTLYTAAKRE